MHLIAKNTNTLINSYGKTKDIADTVISVYLDTYKSVNELAQSFKSPSLGERDLGRGQICRNIFNYVISNVRYIEDPFGVQWVKEPARLLADKSGDCKSMAIFICSCLKCLNIPHFFRFVSFNGRKEATHVYAVAIDEYGNEIYIDPVVRPVQFNKQEKYTYKSDMDGTKIYRLAGIRSISRGRGRGVRSSIGELPSERFAINLGNNNVSAELIQLYARLDLLNETLAITSDGVEAERLRGEIAAQRELINSHNNYISGAIDLLDAEKMAAKMKESGLFYIYLFIPETKIKNYPAIVQQKRATQLKTFIYAEQADIWHNTSACIDLVRSGIIARTGMQPEAFIENAKTNDYQIGAIPIMTILGVISAVLSIISLIRSLFGAKRNEPKESEVNQALMNSAVDFPKNENTGTNTGTTKAGSLLLPLIVGGTALAFLFKKKK